MHKKLTITSDELVYQGLHRVVGYRRISRFIEGLVRPHVIDEGRAAAYEEMPWDEERESEALEWIEGTIGGGNADPRLRVVGECRPCRWRENRRRRPAVIISNHALNRFLNRVQVIPLTSNVDRLYPSEACVTLNGRQNKAMADQLTIVSKLRLIDREGAISVADMHQVERAVKVQLGMSE